MGIEPTSEAWEASILPLYDARSVPKLAKEANGRKRGDSWWAQNKEKGAGLESGHYRKADAPFEAEGQ